MRIRKPRKVHVATITKTVKGKLYKSVLLRRTFREGGNSGGEIDEVPETRLGWSDDHEFHYDLRFKIQDKPVYVETRLLHYKPPFKADNSSILVVNIHVP